MIRYTKKPNRANNPTMKTQNRLCDYCSASVALLYCRADSAKLCLICDREVHSTNQLFSKHTRFQLCDACDSSPASIFCSTESSVLCQNCDWERYTVESSVVHDRRPLEGFIGCPSVVELSAIVGFEDMGNKALFSNCGDKNGGVGSDGVDDFLVWDAPGVVSFDDLITFTDSEHNLKAMDVPPLPKNRNAACGRHKKEMLAQLRDLAKLEPNISYEDVDDEPTVEGSQPVMVPERIEQPSNELIDFKSVYEPIVFPSSEGDGNSGEAASQFFHLNTSIRRYVDESSTVADKHSDGISGYPSYANACHEVQSHCSLNHETLSAPPKAASHQLRIQDRETALSRYKEKKKTRRYDKHIWYESRKVGAESRIRIKGRFAKKDR